ncbi:MAG: hypothetical protein ACREMH_11645 [Gemmatimonadales bacterium]
MSAYKTDQRRVLHRGREFHFVSYDGVPANVRLGLEATLPTWCLMRAGKRWTVIPQLHDQADGDLEVALREWLDANVFAAKASRIRQ